MTTKSVLVILLSVFVFSCNKSDDSDPVANLSDSGSISGENYVVPSEAYLFDANLELYNFTPTLEDKINRAIEVIKLVVATEEFKRQVLNHTYAGRRTYVDNGGYSNSQIYQIIMDGAEKLQPVKNHAIDAEVEAYTNLNSNTVGYTYADSKRIWVNTKYYDRYSAAGVAQNVFHEWLHKLGFKHAASYTPSRDYSVPYAIGDMIGEIGKNFL